MEKLILLPLILLVTFFCKAQFGPANDISRNTPRPYSAHTANLDNDGDLDVLSALSGDHKIAWHENLGGGLFGPQQIITTQAIRASSVYSADFDGNGMTDGNDYGIFLGNFGLDCE